jgi:thiamine-phosphate pyrophosphorylase
MLSRHVHRGKRWRRSSLPHLWFFTDPKRTHTPTDVVARLPRGSAVVYRTFGASNALEVAKTLREKTRRRGVRLLISADEALAVAVRADGIHLPQSLMRFTPRLRRAHPRWLITTAAHDKRVITAGSRLGVDAVMLSAVFPSKSPTAGRALGAVRFASWTQGACVAVVALGGVNSETAARLLGSGAAGLAAVGAFIEEP